MTHSFSYLEPVCCSMSISNYCFLTCIQISQEVGQVVWYFHLLKNLPQFVVIHTVKGFGVVNKAEVAWKIPWMEEPGRLQSKGSLRVRHNLATSLSCTGEGNGSPLQCSCLENPREGGAWWAAICGVAQSRTRLKRLSSSSSADTMRAAKRSLSN